MQLRGMLLGRLVGRLVGYCVLAGLLLAGILFPVAGGLGVASKQIADEVESVSADILEGDVPTLSTITDKDGVPIAYVFDQNRVETPPERIADTMKAAIIAIEDRRFFAHDGVDWRGTTRALLSNVSSSGNALEGQGGSTLTMQYVKNYLLYAVADTDEERFAAVESTPARKLKEVRAALQLERDLDKQEILARYLNIVFFGNNSYGVHSAAKTYFDTTPDRLTISQAALLAGLVRSTETFDPVDNPESALKRRNLVISRMAGTGSITDAQAREAMAEPLGIQDPLTPIPNGCVGAGPADGFFCQYTLDYLAANGFDMEQIRRGGFTIRTSLDRHASDLAKQAASSEVPTTTPGIANAMAIVQPGRDKHRVIALVSNRDYGLRQELGQTSFAQPSTVQNFGSGSIYKIFTAGAAMEKGLGIFTRIPVPGVYTSRVFANGSAPYTVRNAGNYPGSLTLQDALAASPNTAFVALEDVIGSIDPVVDMAYRLGMRTSLDTLDREGRRLADAIKQERRGSYTLGPEPTSPLDLANVAATLMSGGMWCPPSPIESVTDRTGKPVALTESPCEQVVPEGLANTLAVGLSKDDLPGGTAFRAASSAGWNRPMLGKTGTSQDNKSAGFVGATPQYAAAVLIWPDGREPRPICDTDPPQLCGNGNIFGGKVPARTWFKTMMALHEGLPVLPMPPIDPAYSGGRPPLPINRLAVDRPPDPSLPPPPPVPASPLSARPEPEPEPPDPPTSDPPDPPTSDPPDPPTTEPTDPPDPDPDPTFPFPIPGPGPGPRR